VRPRLLLTAACTVLLLAVVFRGAFTDSGDQALLPRVVSDQPGPSAWEEAGGLETGRLEAARPAKPSSGEPSIRKPSARKPSFKRKGRPRSEATQSLGTTARTSRPVPLISSSPGPVAGGEQQIAGGDEGVPTPTGAAEGEAGREAEKPPARITPPVLLTPTASYPREGYSVVLDRTALSPEARLVAAEGKVVIKVLVLADGTVARSEVAASSGHEVLDQAALQASMGWRFRPALRDDLPIDAWVLIPVRFVVP